MLRIGLASLVWMVAGCAPPIGLGPIAAPSRGGGVVTMSTTAAAGVDRESMQVSGSARYDKSWFGIEAGFVSTVTRVRPEDSNTIIAAGGLPYIRPSFRVGRLRVGVGAAGIALGAGGGGFFAGVAEGRASYIHERWTAYASALAAGAEVVGGDSSSSRAAAAGFEYRYGKPGRQLGVALELRAGRETYGCEGCTTVRDRYVIAGLKLRVLRGFR